eukprot:scaffold130474_cov112-Phaeocystis_antarctica.AAC.2
MYTVRLHRPSRCSWVVVPGSAAATCWSITWRKLNPLSSIPELSSACREVWRWSSRPARFVCMQARQTQAEVVDGAEEAAVVARRDARAAYHAHYHAAEEQVSMLRAEAQGCVEGPPSPLQLLPDVASSAALVAAASASAATSSAAASASAASFASAAAFALSAAFSATAAFSAVVVLLLDALSPARAHPSRRRNLMVAARKGRLLQVHKQQQRQRHGREHEPVNNLARVLVRWVTPPLKPTPSSFLKPPPSSPLKPPPSSPLQGTRGRRLHGRRLQGTQGRRLHGRRLQGTRGRRLQGTR